MLIKSIELIRPKTLVASLSPVLISAAWALKFHKFDFFLFSLLFLTAVFLQILANVANDYFDGIKGTDNEKRVGPLRFTGSGLISIKVMKTILISCFCITLFLGLLLSYFSSPIVGCVFGISLVLAIIYTAGPFSLSYLGIAEPFAFSFFGPIPAFFAAYVYTKEFYFLPLLLGSLPGLYSVILITINNLRDYETDKEAKKLTQIVKRGREFGKKMVLGLLISQVVITLIIGLFLPKFLFSLILLPEAYYLYKQIKGANTSFEFALLLKECAKVYVTSTLLWISFTMI